jgi:hypothetical protein
MNSHQHHQYCRQDEAAILVGTVINGGKPQSSTLTHDPEELTASYQLDGLSVASKARISKFIRENYPELFE